MSDTEDPSSRGPRGVPKDARTRFAELLRRAERNGERIRLTRRGTPIAYIVPLADGERLRRFDDMAKRASDQPMAAAPPPPQQPELPEILAKPLDPVSPPVEGKPGDSLPPLLDDPDPPLVDHGDETERHIAITAFKKVVTHILVDTQTLTRPEILNRFKHDNYIGTAVKKVIGEGGDK